jgi:hypothetical protein
MPNPTITLTALFTDMANRRLLAHTIEAVQLDSGLSYPAALDRVYDAAEAAHNAGQPTLAGLLQHALGDAEGMGESLKLLEARDATVVREHTSKAPKQLDRDPFGRVLLSQSYKGRPKSLDADGRLTDPAEFEKRLTRARRLDASYADELGRRRFQADDDAYLRGGVDMLKTLELDSKARAADARAGQTARELDAEVAAEGERRRGLRQLDREIADLQGKRRELATPAGEGLKLLDQGGGEKSKGRQLTSQERLQERLDRRVRKRLRRLGRPESDYVFALEAEVRGDPMPPKQPKQPEAPEVPSGVHPGSHALHRRIVARQRELDCSYTTAYESILAEEA